MGNETLSHIFISYKTEDRDTAQKLRLALRAEFKNAVWWDQDLQTGGQWSQEIDAKLSSAACVVVLWSKLSVQSQWVQQEAAVAKALGTLTPAQIDDCVIPTPYAGVHAARLINWQGNENDAEFVKLVARVRACLNQSPGRLFSPPPPPQGIPSAQNGAGSRQSIREKIESNLVIWTLLSLLAGFGAGFGAYETILKTAQLEPVRSSTIKQFEAEIQRLEEENSSLKTKSSNTQAVNSQTEPQRVLIPQVPPPPNLEGRWIGNLECKALSVITLEITQHTTSNTLKARFDFVQQIPGGRSNGWWLSGKYIPEEGGIVFSECDDSTNPAGCRTYSGMARTSGDKGELTLFGTAYFKNGKASPDSDACKYPFVLRRLG